MNYRRLICAFFLATLAASCSVTPQDSAEMRPIAVAQPEVKTSTPLAINTPVVKASDIYPRADVMSSSPSDAASPARPMGAMISRVPVGNRKVVALTFDDGPHGTLTPRVLDILSRHRAKGTFFVQGVNIGGKQGILRRMVTEGHEVANHSWNHAYLSKVSAQEVDSQLTRTNAAIVSACGVSPLVMRPPGGYMNSALASQIRSQHGLRTIMWNVDTNDWRKPGLDVVVSRAVNGASPGAIILVHDIHASTVAAVEAIVSGLQARGYDLVTVSELISMALCAAPCEVESIVKRAE